MRAFTSARYTVPLGHHSYPMDKYRLVPARLLADGTLAQDEMCQADAEVFTFSMHGENNYPARKERSSWDIMLPDGTTDERYLDTLTQALPHILERFIPDVILYQAGVDVLAGDRFGKLALTMEG